MIGNIICEKLVEQIYLR